jgi:hypothetical protein
MEILTIGNSNEWKDTTTENYSFNRKYHSIIKPLFIWFTRKFLDSKTLSVTQMFSIYENPIIRNFKDFLRKRFSKLLSNYLRE